MFLDLFPYPDLPKAFRFPKKEIGHLPTACVKIPAPSCTGLDADPAERSAHPGLRGRGQGAVQGLW